MIYDKMKRLSDKKHSTSSAASHAHFGIRDEHKNNLDCFFRIKSCHDTIELHPVKNNLGQMGVEQYIAYAKKLRTLAEELNAFASFIESQESKIESYLKDGFEVLL